MSEEKDERRGFRVTDRRRFAETGEARTDTQPEPARPAPETPQSSRPTETAAQEVVTFSTFVLGLSTQALSLLGEIPDPHTGQVARDLGGAKQLIDILGILREKTRNNLAHGEETLLDSILYDLRMRYVELARSGKES